MNTGFTKSAFLAGLLACGASSYAATIYDNVAGLGDPPDRTSITGNAEIGDRVTFAGTDRILENWSFEYWVEPGSVIQGQAFLYTVDGVGNPGTMLYQSPIVPNMSVGTDALGYGSFMNTPDTVVVLPDSVIWTVLFTDVEAGEEYGLLFTGTPEIGSSEDNFFVRTGGSWGMADTATLEDSFSARFNAVPEPSTWALLVGGLGLLSFWSFRRKL